MTGRVGAQPDQQLKPRITREMTELRENIFLSKNITCILQVTFAIVSRVGDRSKSAPRSGCPVSMSLEAVGDRWSLLIIRDLMVRGFTTFKQFQDGGEHIATNILAD